MRSSHAPGPTGMSGQKSRCWMMLFNSTVVKYVLKLSRRPSVNLIAVGAAADAGPSGRPLPVPASGWGTMRGWAKYISRMHRCSGTSAV